MYSKDDINKLYREIAASIDISDDMFTAAVDEYESLGKWIDENTPQYQISIYPQGSFGLGTVVKPINIFTGSVATATEVGGSSQ